MSVSLFEAPGACGSGSRGRLRLLMILALAVTLGACAGTRGGPIPYNVDSFGPPDSPLAQTLEADYRIAPLDTLKIDVFGVKDLSDEYEVDLTGHIAMPLIGNVKAADLTLVELDRSVTAALGERYLQSPDVSIGVKSSTRRNVTVDGSVRQPGLYPITGPMTLMQAVALARGADENSNPRRVAIFRQVDGQRMAAAFDLVSIRRGQAEDPKVYSGDIVIVDGATMKEVYRNVMAALPVVSLFRPY